MITPQALGRHLHTVDCCLLTDAAALRRLLFGALHTGSILQLDNLHHLPNLLMIHLAKWLETVAKALAMIPPFMAKQPRDSALANSVRSSPAPIRRETFQSNPEYPSPKQDTRPSSVPRPSEHSSLNPPPTRSLGTLSNSVMSQQSSRLLPSHMTERTHTRASSRATTRLDWYLMSRTCKLEEVSLFNWCGYGGEVRRPVEIDSEVLHVSPAFGCVLVADTAACFIPEQLKVRHNLTHS